MSKGQTLKLLVNERLSAAAEEIFALFESAIAEYEVELFRSNEENQRKQRMLDSVLNPTVKLHRWGTQFPSQGPCLKQDITKTLCVKEEVEEEQLPQPLPEMLFCVKTESPELKQTQEEELLSPLNSEGDTRDNSNTDDRENWEAPISCSPAQTETEANVHDYNQVHIRDAAQISGLSPKYNFAQGIVATGDMSGIGEGAGSTVQDPDRPLQCSVCEKRFWTKGDLQRHVRVHTGERPFSCSVCMKTFGQKSHLVVHERRHAGVKPYNCAICDKAFINRSALTVHVKSHTGEKPFSCVICQKHFVSKCYLKTHMRFHTGERPYSCSVCKKTFYSNSGYNVHIRRHTGETLYCSVCKRIFSCSRGLKIHMKRHTSKRSYTCSICNHTFTQKGSLDTHMKRKHAAVP